MIRFAALLLGASLASVASAQDNKVATCVAHSGALLVRQGDSWQPVKVNDAVPAGVPLVSIPFASLKSANGEMQVNLISDLGKRTPLPVLEAAITLNAAKDCDLDVTLDRGIVSFINLKKEGSARVRLRFRDEQWMLTLRAPNSRCGVEVYGRLVPGDKQGEPVSHVIFFCGVGSAFVELAKHGYALEAPPGASLMGWDSVERRAEVQHFDAIPAEFKALLNHEDKEFLAQCAAGTRFQEAGAKLLASEDRCERQTAVTLLGATDRLGGLLDAASSERADVRHQAILALRHWLGREPGQVGKLQKFLVQEKKLTPVQAKTTVSLLVGFSEAQRRLPQTYELLILLLEHKNVAVRELAHWHLTRLAPAGRDIPFDAAASHEQRDQAITRWRALIPDGQLPPPAKKST